MPSKPPRMTGSLNVLVGTAIALWAVTFSFVYGPFVFGYLAMHAATTGVFLLAIHRSDQARAKQLALQPARRAVSVSTSRPKTERIAQTQPAA